MKVKYLFIIYGQNYLLDMLDLCAMFMNNVRFTLLCVGKQQLILINIVLVVPKLLQTNTKIIH